MERPSVSNTHKAVFATSRNSYLESMYYVARYGAKEDAMVAFKDSTMEI